MQIAKPHACYVCSCSCSCSIRVRVCVRVRRSWCDVVCCSCSCSGLMLCGVFVVVFVFSNVKTNCVRVRKTLFRCNPGAKYIQKSGIDCNIWVSVYMSRQRQEVSTTTKRHDIEEVGESAKDKPSQSNMVYAFVFVALESGPCPATTGSEYTFLTI